MKNELDQRTPSIGYDIKRLKVTMVAMPLTLNNPVTGSSYVLCTVSSFWRIIALCNSYNTGCIRLLSWSLLLLLYPSAVEKVGFNGKALIIVLPNFLFYRAPVYCVTSDEFLFISVNYLYHVDLIFPPKVYSIPLVTARPA